MGRSHVWLRTAACRGIITFFYVLGVLLLIQPRIWLAAFATGAHCCVVLCLAVKTRRSCSVKLLLTHLAMCPVVCSYSRLEIGGFACLIAFSGSCLPTFPDYWGLSKWQLSSSVHQPIVSSLASLVGFAEDAFHPVVHLLMKMLYQPQCLPPRDALVTGSLLDLYHWSQPIQSGSPIDYFFLVCSVVQLSKLSNLAMSLLWNHVTSFAEAKVASSAFPLSVEEVLSLFRIKRLIKHNSSLEKSFASCSQLLLFLHGSENGFPGGFAAWPFQGLEVMLVGL